jgi:hypothetical protein
MPPNKNMYVQENNMEYRTLMPDEAENYNRVAANYPDETVDADYEMGNTHYR